MSFTTQKTLLTSVQILARGTPSRTAGDMTSQLAAGAAPFVPPPPANDTAAAEPTPPEPRATSTADESSRDRDGLLLLLAVSIIAFAALCWWLEHLAFLLKPLVFAVALSLILRPVVDFTSDRAYQAAKLREWDVRTPWHPRVFVLPRFVGLVLSMCLVVLVVASFIWALYVSEQWIQYHWRDESWNARFSARVNDLAAFADGVASKVLRRDDFALDAWHALQQSAENLVKDETFWTSFGSGLFLYLGDAAICLVYVLFLVAPPRTPIRSRSRVARRIHASAQRFIVIMVILAAARAVLVGLLILACGVPSALAGSIAIVSFWLYFIPNLGSFVAALIPVPLVLLLPDMTEAQRWCALFIPAFGSFLVGDIVGPMMYRKGLDLNEVVILLSIIFWFSVWNGVGAVLAVPIMCMVKIVMEEIPHAGTHFIAKLMAPSPSAASGSGSGSGGNDDDAASRVTADFDSDENGSDGAPSRPRGVLESAWRWVAAVASAPRRRGRRQEGYDVLLDGEEEGRRRGGERRD